MASNSVHLRAFDRGSSIITSVDLGHFSKKKLRKVSFLLLSELPIRKERIKDDKTKIIKPVYYFNERGGVVFISIEPPTTSIVIMNTKPDYSRYQKNCKILGKNKNIKIYEAPGPKTKVTIRTLNGKRK